MYNQAAQPYISVSEFWEGIGQTVNHLKAAEYNTMIFDFPLKYTLGDAIVKGSYSLLKNPANSLRGKGYAKYAVTFIDNHDTFERSDSQGNQFGGYNVDLGTDKVKAQILQANAYILMMPGIPCVFYPHWVSFKDKIKPMINARYKTGVHSESAVSDEAGNGYYKATITGTNGQIRLLVGPNSGYNSTPAGFTLAVKGENYGVYYKVNSPRGDKNTSRSDISLGMEEIVEQTPSVKAEKFMQDGKLYIRCGEQVFDITGQRIY